MFCKMRFAVRGSLFLVAFAASASLANAATCEDLSNLSLPNTAITIAQPVPAGGFVAPVQARGRGNNPFADLPPFCRVFGQNAALGALRAIGRKRGFCD